MIYCLINNSSFHGNNVKINYSLINDYEELRINKIFDIDLSKSNVIYPKFSKAQLNQNRIQNFIKEISNDFMRSKYILGKEDFEICFLRMDEFEDIRNTFKVKYLKLNQVVRKFSYLKCNNSKPL